MKVVKKVVIGPSGYILDLENGEFERHPLDTVKEEGIYNFIGLKDRQILEEYLDIEGRKKRILYLEDRLLQLQEVYVCKCGGNMTVKHFESGYTGGYGGYYDDFTYHECETCKKEYIEKRTYAEPDDCM